MSTKAEQFIRFHIAVIPYKSVGEILDAFHCWLDGNVELCEKIMCRTETEENK